MSQTKTCTKCGNELPATEENFRVHKAVLNSQCRACDREYARKWNNEHPEKRKISKARYQKVHSESYTAYLVQWRKDHPGYATIESKKWYHANLDKARAGRRKQATRARSKIENRLHANVSRGIHHMLANAKAGRHWPEILGYTIEELKHHLESKFLPGMSWDNYGLHGWHIDHIIPKEFFEFNSAEDAEFQYCWSLNNLQPMWAEDNIRKSNKIEWAA